MKSCRCPYDSLFSAAVTNAFMTAGIFWDDVGEENMEYLQAIIDGYWSLYKRQVSNFGQCARLCDCEGSRCSGLLNAQVYAAAVQLLLSYHMFLIFDPGEDNDRLLYAINTANKALSSYSIYPDKYRRRGDCSKCPSSCCKNACSPFLLVGEGRIVPEYVGQEISLMNNYFCVSGQSPAEVFLTYFNLAYSSIEFILFDEMADFDALFHYLDVQLCILPPHPLFGYLLQSGEEEADTPID